MNNAGEGRGMAMMSVNLSCGNFAVKLMDPMRSPCEYILHSPGHLYSSVWTAEGPVVLLNNRPALLRFWLVVLVGFVFKARLKLLSHRCPVIIYFCCVRPVGTLWHLLLILRGRFSLQDIPDRPAVRLLSGYFDWTSTESALFVLTN